MSAFVVSHDHIDALLTFAKDKRMLDRLAYLVDPGELSAKIHSQPLKVLTRIRRVLLAQDERSVGQSYS